MQGAGGWVYNGAEPLAYLTHEGGGTKTPALAAMGQEAQMASKVERKNIVLEDLKWLPALSECTWIAKKRSMPVSMYASCRSARDAFMNHCAA
jgi:hypothetical protein